MVVESAWEAVVSYLGGELGWLYFSITVIDIYKECKYRYGKGKARHANKKARLFPDK